MKEQIVESLGTTISDAMGTPLRPISSMSIPQIMEYLVVTYGVVTKLDLQVFLDDCKKPCESNSEYFAHAKRIKRNFEELAQHRATVSEYQQMELLIQSTGHLPVIMEARQVSPRYTSIC